MLAEPDERPPGEVAATPGRLRVRPSSAGTSYLATDRSPWATPVLATSSVEWPDAPEAPTTGGMARPARVLATADALPVVGAAGTVLDLPTSVVPGTGAVARAEPLVLARADTPESVLAQVGTPRQGPSSRARSSRPPTTGSRGGSPCSLPAARCSGCWPSCCRPRGCDASAPTSARCCVSSAYAGPTSTPPAACRSS